MARQSQAWKALERQTAEALRGKRVLRGANFAESDVDVQIADLPFLRVDCKYRVRHSHHSLAQEIVDKYCAAGDIPVLVTKSHNQVGAFATIPLEFLATLLDAVRKLRIIDINSAQVNSAVNAEKP